MKRFIKVSACLLLCGLLFANCESRRSFNIQLQGINNISIDGVKAFASLSKTSPGQRTTLAEGSDSYLYAIDDFNVITLPKISCNFVFGDDMTEEERRQVIEDMNATIQTRAMYDLGPYVLIKYMLSYTSSYIYSGSGVDITVSLGDIFIAVRKSDGKVFRVQRNEVVSWLDDMLRRGVLFNDQIQISEGDTYIRTYALDGTIMFSEQGDMLAVRGGDGAYYLFFRDENGNEYTLDDVYRIISSYIGEHYGCIIRQIGNRPYVFVTDDESHKICSIVNFGLHFEKELSLANNVLFGDCIEAGSVNGEYLWVSAQKIVKYNALTKAFSIESISPELMLDEYSRYSYAFVNGYAYRVDEKSSGDVELVKINLLTQQQEVIKIDLPQDVQPVWYSFVGAAASNLLRLRVETTSTPYFINISGEDDLPDFDGYVVHEVIPLK